MFAESFAFLAILRVVFSATAVCSTQTPCQCVFGAGQVIDLSTIGTLNHPRFYDVPSKDEDVTSLYSYNPCFQYDSPDSYVTVKDGNVPCKNAAGCVKSPGSSSGDPPEEHAIGIQGTAKFLADEGSNFHIFYDLQKKGHQNLTVILQCNHLTLHELYINQTEVAGNGSVIMTLVTKCACPPYSCASSPKPDESSHGLSTGSTLLIVFFSVLLAYFLIGITWNFCNGAHGTELVPNVDFWNELPKLVIEGVAFTCSCFGRKRSYGEV